MNFSEVWMKNSLGYENEVRRDRYIARELSTPINIPWRNCACLTLLQKKEKKKWRKAACTLAGKRENEEEISFAREWASSRGARENFSIAAAARFTIFISYRINLQVSLIWIELLEEEFFFLFSSPPFSPTGRTMHKRERVRAFASPAAVGIFSINAPVLFPDITVRRVGGNAHAGEHGHKNIAKCRDWRLKRTVCSPVMEEIYVDAISTRALPSGSSVRNLYVAYLILLPRSIKLDEYLQCGTVSSYLKRLIYNLFNIDLTLVLLQRYFFKVKIVIHLRYSANIMCDNKSSKILTNRS